MKNKKTEMISKGGSEPAFRGGGSVTIGFFFNGSAKKKEFVYTLNDRWDADVFFDTIQTVVTELADSVPSDFDEVQNEPKTADAAKRKYMKKYMTDYNDKTKKYRSDFYKKYYAENREAILAKAKANRKVGKYKETMRTCSKDWLDRHPGYMQKRYEETRQ